MPGVGRPVADWRADLSEDATRAPADLRADAPAKVGRSPRGGCACAAVDAPIRPTAQAGGFYDTYSQARDRGRFVPVDAYVPGCPPRIEDLIDTIDGLQRKIRHKG